MGVLSTYQLGIGLYLRRSMKAVLVPKNARGDTRYVACLVPRPLAAHVSAWKGRWIDKLYRPPIRHIYGYIPTSCRMWVRSYRLAGHCRHNIILVWLNPHAGAPRRKSTPPRQLNLCIGGIQLGFIDNCTVSFFYLRLGLVYNICHFVETATVELAYDITLLKLVEIRAPGVIGLVTIRGKELAHIILRPYLMDTLGCLARITFDHIPFAYGSEKQQGKEAYQDEGFRMHRLRRKFEHRCPSLSPINKVFGLAVLHDNIEIGYSVPIHRYTHTIHRDISASKIHIGCIDTYMEM